MTEPWTDDQRNRILRNAADVQVRRGWHAKKSGDVWFVDLWGAMGLLSNSGEPVVIESFHPAVALIEADRWMKEQEGKK